MEKYIYILFIISIISEACTKCVSPENPVDTCTACDSTSTVSVYEFDSTKTNIRVKNEIGCNMCNIYVDTYGTLNTAPNATARRFGNLAQNATSGYLVFDRAYNIAWVKTKIQNKTYFLRPYDYSGEPLLGKGNFTFIFRKLSTDTSQIYFVVKKN